MQVIEVPDIDLAAEVARARDQMAPTPFARPFPSSKFVVHFEAKRLATSSPGPLIFYLHKRRSGKLYTISAGIVKPTEINGVWHYRGICRKPTKRGAAIMEVRGGGKSYLVRATEVR